MPAKQLGWVLSIQSHVAYGYVGNSAAVFALQRLGIPVLAINTVQFSNHTGYGEFRGSVFSEEDLTNVILGLQERGVLQHCQAVLSGYLGAPSSGNVVLQALQWIRQYYPEATYLCDPVMGDVGRGVFVKSGIPEFLAEKALAQANIITPNQFEFEYLLKRKLLSTEDTIEAAQKLMRQFPLLNCVVITSLLTSDIPKKQLRTLAVTSDQAFAVDSPFINLTPIPNGMGDLFSAIFLGKWLLTKRYDLALSHAVASLSELLNKIALGSRDLPIIEHQNAIVSPELFFESKDI